MSCRKPYETDTYSYLGDYIYRFKQDVPADKDGDPFAYEASKFYFQNEIEQLEGPYETEEAARAGFLAFQTTLTKAILVKD